MSSHFEQERKLRVLTEPLASFGKEETIISKRYFEAMFEKLPQTIKEFVLKTYELSIFGLVLSTDMVTRVHINSILHKICSQHGQIKDHSF